MKLIIDLSGRGGLSPNYTTQLGVTQHPNLSYLSNNEELVQGQFNPFREYGFISPINNNYTQVLSGDIAGNVMTSRWTCTYLDLEDGIMYVGEDGLGTPALGALAWERHYTTNSAFATLVNGSAIIDYVNKYIDIKKYQLNGIRQVFFSYESTAGVDILLFTNSSTVNPTWLSTTVTNPLTPGATSDLFMVVADNGYMYLLDANNIHKLDGTVAGGANGTLTHSVIQFNLGIYIRDAIDWRGNLWIAMQNSPMVGYNRNTTAEISEELNTAGVYVWDRISKITGKSNFIKIEGVRDMRKLYVTPNGKLRAITLSSLGHTQIREYNGVTFAVIAELGTHSFPVFRDSVKTIGNNTVWLGQDGLIYLHGRIKSGDKEGIYIVGNMTAESGQSPNGGAIIVWGTSSQGYPSGLILSASNSPLTTAVQLYFNINESGTTSGTGDIYTKSYSIPKLSTVSTIDIFCAPTTNTGTTETATISVYTNMSTAPFKVHSVTKDQTTRGYIRIPIDKPFVNSVQLKISWNTSVVIGDDTFLPMYAEVDYTPTKTAA